jgi:hypothetical protein
MSGQALQVTYGAKGVQTLRFNGVLLEDIAAYPEDSFHIWHMKATDLSGKPCTEGQCGWGELNLGTTWDSSSKTETYRFTWGSIQTQFVQNGDNLDMVVTETNNAGSGVVFDGAEIYPLALHFPQDPRNFNGLTQYAITTTGPGVSVADFGRGVVAAVAPDASQPLYVGWKIASGTTYSPLMTSTSPDGLATFLPHMDRPVQPGASFTYRISLRFASAGVSPNAADAYASFAKTYPSQMTWADHRLIGTAFLASSPAGDKTQPGGFRTNPRRYFNDASVDVTTVAGLKAFQNRVLATATAEVANTRAMNGQGVMTWDIEGEQYPQDTSYVCSPEQVATVAPEMESGVLDTASPYYGQRLDDAYFKTILRAGLKVGVCVRPQVFVRNADGTAAQTFLAKNEEIIANLEKKISFAYGRWGATMFYVDSTVDVNGGTLDPAIFQRLITDFPAFLFIPEESTPRYYAYTAPFYSFLFHGSLGTDASVYRYYPHAFGVNLVNDVAAKTLAANLPALTAQVSRGDVLMGLATYWQENDATLASLYRAAGLNTPAPVTRITPSIWWVAPAAITAGTPLRSAQLNAVANTAGTFTYVPAAGTVLGPGTYTLTTTFTPADPGNFTTATATVPLKVNAPPFPSRRK